MWKVVLLVGFASAVLQSAEAQGGAESLPFHGFLPSESIRERAPKGDDQPNDIYSHLPVRRPKLENDEVVIYPHHFGFELGQDPEHSIYEVHSAKELASLSHHKHGKHGKHAHDHHDHDHHHHHGKASKDATKGGSKTLKPVPPPTTSKPITPPNTQAPRKPSPNYPAPPPARPFNAIPPPHGAYPPPPPPPGAFAPRPQGSYNAPPPPRPYPYQHQPAVFPPRHG